jgi:hypothetical protein
MRARVLALAVVLFSQGCAGVAADLAASFLGSGADTLRGYFDYESAGGAAGTTILQFEALHGASPNNETIMILLSKAYIAYAFGWVMDEHQAALAANDFETADYHKQRAYWMYKRARDLLMRAMRLRDEGIDEVLHGDPDRLASYLIEEYDDEEDDPELLLWCAVAWGSTITNSPEMDAMIDLPIAKTLAQHVATLDEEYEKGAALALLGGFEVAYPRSLGGDWEKGRAYFERALEISQRRDHLHQLNYARLYAVNAMDRELFVSLLREIIDAPDLGADVRMSNKVARRRAQRYLANVDEWFY